MYFRESPVFGWVTKIICKKIYKHGVVYASKQLWNLHSWNLRCAISNPRRYIFQTYQSLQRHESAQLSNISIPTVNINIAVYWPFRLIPHSFTLIIGWTWTFFSISFHVSLVRLIPSWILTASAVDTFVPLFLLIIWCLLRISFLFATFSSRILFLTSRNVTVGGVARNRIALVRWRHVSSLGSSPWIRLIERSSSVVAWKVDHKKKKRSSSVLTGRRSSL